MDRSSGGAGSMALGIIALVVAVVVVIGGAAWLFSWHGVDAGHVAIVKEGGPFDGRSLKEVRAPGSGAKPIGAFNHQYSLPTTQRDLTDEMGQITVPTRDGVNVVVDGQALFQLIVDLNDNVKQNLDIKFFQNFGLRPWNGQNLWDPEGFVEFEKIRLVPILYQSIRSVIGQFDCTSLNNTCVYVLNANVLADTDAAAKAQQKAKSVNTEQNLTAAQDQITTSFKQNLREGLGEDYFEGVRFQNLRVTFPEAIRVQIENAQAKRAQVASAKLDAQRKVQEAEGNTEVAKQQAQQIRVKANAYQANPQQADIDKIRALCGDTGCQNLQVIGSGSSIVNLKNQQP